MAGLDFGWCSGAEFRVESLVVPPSHPLQGRELDLRGGAPWPLLADQLRFVEGIDGLGEGIVVAVAEGTSRGCGAELDSPMGVNQAHVVRAMVGVMSQSGEITASCERGDVQCHQRQDVRVEGRSDVEAADLSGEHVGDESDAGLALPRSHIGDVNKSMPARRGGGEPALHQV